MILSNASNCVGFQSNNLKIAISDAKKIICDLVNGAGYSYSRIAYRIGVSPSAIQKIVVNPNRKPRYENLKKLYELHQKVFHGPYVSQRAKSYMQSNRQECIVLGN